MCMRDTPANHPPATPIRIDGREGGAVLFDPGVFSCRKRPVVLNLLTVVVNLEVRDAGHSADMRITLLGHACIRIDGRDGGAVLFDPGVFSPDAASGGADIDAVLITHQHGDHVDTDVLKEVLEVSDVPVLAEAAAAEVVRNADLTAETLEPGDSHTWSGLSAHVVGGDHAVIHPDIPSIGNVGVVMDDGATRLFHPGDSYGTVPEDIDVLALPLSAPWASLADTVEFARAVAPRLVVPIHDGLLRPAARAIYLNLVAELCRTETLDPHAGIPFPVSG